jgi:ABC-type oligopeptide transport system substrate-binding subunit
MAIDREALAETYFNGSMLAAEQFTQPGIVAAPQTDYTLYDPEQARAAFAQAGFPECTNVPETLILLVPDDDPLWEELGNAVTQQWASVLGCNAALFEVKPVPRTLLIELSHANYDPEQVTRSHMWLFTWSADYPDAHAWTNDALHCRYGYIRNGRECGQADSLLDSASLAYDENERASDYAAVEDLFFGARGTYPVAPLFVESAAWLQQPWLSGLNTNGAARYDLWMLDATAQSDA